MTDDLMRMIVRGDVFLARAEAAEAALAASQAEVSALKAELATATNRDALVSKLIASNAERDTLAASLERARDALERIGGPVGDSRCPNCSGHLDDSFEHFCGADDCAGFIARRALEALRPPTPIATPGTPTEEET